MILSFCFSVFVVSLSVSAEEIESKVTVRIVHDDTLEPEKSKESANDSSKQKYKESNIKLNKKVDYHKRMSVLIHLSQF